MNTVLAVDGGNSKTDLAIVDMDGTVLAAVRGPGSSPHHVGVAGSVERIGAPVLVQRFNPVVALQSGCGAVDARIRVAVPAKATSLKSW